MLALKVSYRSHVENAEINELVLWFDRIVASTTSLQFSCNCHFNRCIFQVKTLVVTSMFMIKTDTDRNVLLVMTRNYFQLQGQAFDT